MLQLSIEWAVISNQLSTSSCASCQHARSDLIVTGTFSCSPNSHHHQIFCSSHTRCLQTACSVPIAALAANSRPGLEDMQVGAELLHCRSAVLLPHHQAMHLQPLLLCGIFQVPLDPVTWGWDFTVSDHQNICL